MALYFAQPERLPQPTRPTEDMFPFRRSAKRDDDDLLRLLRGSSCLLSAAQIF